MNDWGKEVLELSIENIHDWTTHESVMVAALKEKYLVSVVISHDMKKEPYIKCLQITLTGNELDKTIDSLKKAKQLILKYQMKTRKKRENNGGEDVTKHYPGE